MLLPPKLPMVTKRPFPPAAQRNVSPSLPSCGADQAFPSDEVNREPLWPMARKSVLGMMQPKMEVYFVRPKPRHFQSRDRKGAGSSRTRLTAPLRSRLRCPVLARVGYISLPLRNGCELSHTESGGLRKALVQPTAWAPSNPHSTRCRAHFGLHSAFVPVLPSFSHFANSGVGRDLRGGNWARDRPAAFPVPHNRARTTERGDEIFAWGRYTARCGVRKMNSFKAKRG